MLRKEDWPKVSVVVPCFNSGYFYKSFLESLRKLDYPNFEVIIVDDNSTDGSFEHIQGTYGNDSRFKLIRTLKRENVAGSRNIGIMFASGKYIAFAEMDMEVDKNWLKFLVEALEIDKDLGAVTSLCYDFFKRDKIICAGIHIMPQVGWTICLGFGKDIKKVSHEVYTGFGGVGSMVRKELLKKVRGFDTKTPAQIEDLDLGWRVWLFGGRVKYIPQAVVYHWSYKPWSFRKEITKIDKEFHFFKTPRMLIKNLETRSLIKYLPQCILILVLRMMINLLRGNFYPLIGGSLSFAWQIFMLPDTLKERKFIQENRKFSDQELMNKLFESGGFVKNYFSKSLPNINTTIEWSKNVKYVPGTI